MKLIYEKSFIEEIRWFSKNDPRNLKKVKKLLQNIQESPFEGMGKPEPLKHEFAGYWSRRIDRKNRIIYKVNENSIWLISCRGHYE